LKLQWDVVKKRNEGRYNTFVYNVDARYQAYVAAFKAKKLNVDETALIGKAKAGNVAATLMIKAADDEIAKLEKACKAYDYSYAQKLKKAFDKQVTDDVAASKKLKGEYETAHPAAAAGTKEGNRCEKKAGVKYADGEQDRAVCDADAKLCCGSAHKFLRDGSRLTIESCQKDTTTEVTYWPPFPAGALVNPQSETWRFACISAAQKLMASATVALSAIYLMH